MSGSVAELCLCDTHLCNGHAIEEFGEAQFDEDYNSIAESYAKEGGYDEGFGLADTYGTSIYKYSKYSCYMLV